jgi:hypothetical protein
MNFDIDRSISIKKCANDLLDNNLNVYICHEVIMVIEYLMSRFRSQKWKGVIGLEIHAQINTESKLFSGAEKNFGSP